MFHTKQKGFTLIEMIIVFTMIAILVGLALPQFRTSLRSAKESALRDSLFTMRKLLAQYYTDKGKYPLSLQALVDENYLYKIPKDPITGTSDTWVEVHEQPSMEDIAPGTEFGIVDVHSGSKEKALDGTLYETW
jgi:general secretion pathway protein G